MTVCERLIIDASKHAAVIAPCGWEVIAALTVPEAEREIAEIEDLSVRVYNTDHGEIFRGDDYVLLPEIFLLTITGDNGEAMGPWQLHMAHTVDAWEAWYGCKAGAELCARVGRPIPQDELSPLCKTGYQPNRATLRGHACEVAWYFRRYRPAEMHHAPTTWAALHHYGPSWLHQLRRATGIDEFPEEDNPEWLSYCASFLRGLEKYKELGGE